jgi:hypothetical protein
VDVNWSQQCVVLMALASDGCLATLLLACKLGQVRSRGVLSCGRLGATRVVKDGSKQSCGSMAAGSCVVRLQSASTGFAPSRISWQVALGASSVIGASLLGLVACVHRRCQLPPAHG